jgi:hypothetical protein
MVDSARILLAEFPVHRKRTLYIFRFSMRGVTYVLTAATNGPAPDAALVEMFRDG